MDFSSFTSTNSQKKDPQTYQKLRNIEAEQEQIAKQDAIIERQQDMLEKQNAMLEKYGTMPEKMMKEYNKDSEPHDGKSYKTMQDIRDDDRNAAFVKLSRDIMKKVDKDLEDKGITPNLFDF